MFPPDTCYKILTHESILLCNTWRGLFIFRCFPLQGTRIKHSIIGTKSTGWYIGKRGLGKFILEKRKDRANVKAAFKYFIACQGQERWINSDLFYWIGSRINGCRLFQDQLGHNTKNRVLMEHSKNMMHYPRKDFLAVDKTEHRSDNHVVGISYKDSFR